MSCFENVTSIPTSVIASTAIPSIMETLAALQLPYSISLPSTSTAAPPSFFSTALPMPFQTSLPTIATPSITIDPIPVQPSLLPPSIFSSLTTSAQASELAQLLATAAGSPSRRLSCPETSSSANNSLEVPTPDRRRYSDGYSVDAILRDSFLPIASTLQFPCPSTTLYQPMNTEHIPPPHRRQSGTRKQRTIYGSRQTEVLEEAFHSQKYMVGAERELLAARLGLTEAQVRVWFQNRRSKFRKLSKSGDEK